MRFGDSGAVLPLTAEGPGWSLDNVEFLEQLSSVDDLCGNAKPLVIGANVGTLNAATPTNPQPASCDAFTTAAADCSYVYLATQNGDLRVSRSGGSITSSA